MFSAEHEETASEAGEMKRRKKNPSELLLMSGNPAKRRRRNPAELLLMSGNPLSKLERQREARERATRIRGARLNSPYDQLSVDERLAFGRLGLGKAQLQSKSDVARARRKVAEVNRFRNHLPNPGLTSLDSPQAEHAQELREAFTAHESDRYTVVQEPHVPAGDYALLGKLIALRVKPERGGILQEISFPGKHILVIATANGRHIYFVGEGQDLSAAELELFTESSGNTVELGECRSIVYEAAKWHEAVPAVARGKKVDWEHQFGEDGGYPPRIVYLRLHDRLALEGGSYHVEGAGIVN